jgi:serine/threonine protein kinase/tetratricopeptide (TPR) repeat protein
MTETSQDSQNCLLPTIVANLRHSFAASRRLKRDLLAEQRAGWDQGKPPSPEEILPRWPASPSADGDVASVLFQDFCQRRRVGEEPSLEDYARRFPDYKASLAGLLSRQAVLESIGAASGASEGALLGLPDVGDELFGFRLRRELGRGAFARVFEAEQATLAARAVALKISGIDGDEPQTLAQLQHTNIVPIYSVHEDARAGLRAVCMPYLGGVSLSRVLQKVWTDATPRQGAELLRALDALEAEARGESSAAPGSKSPPSDDTGTPRSVLARLDYIRGAAWVVERLAEGLQHAHQRGVLHRDIKPSNVLLAADGQPLLLDFNLAHQEANDRAHAVLGGTVAYMAPEHLRALVGRSPALARLVDERSDLYALGMVLYELLTGHSPFDQSASYSVMPMVIEAMAVERSQAAPSVRKKRTDVPWSLESITRKCLAPDPADRYQRAEHLAQDLRRFLDDRPLRHAPEPSRVERVHKWARRHPRLTSSGTVAAAALVLLSAGGFGLAAVHDHLADSRARERRQAYEQGTVRALCLVNTVTDVSDHLREGLAVTEETLALYHVLDDPRWQERADWRRLTAAERARLAEDTRELLLLLAWARVRSQPANRAILEEALGLLDRAEAVEGLPASRALLLDRASYLEQLGNAESACALRKQAETVQPAGARDHYLLASSYARTGAQGGYARALAELDRALALNPRLYWAWVQRGICRKERGEHTLAAGDFGACIGLWPELAWGYFNRGTVFQDAGRRAEAIADYTAALERDPSFTLASLNRGLCRLELGQNQEALADFDQTLAGGRDEAFVHSGRAIALEGLGRHNEADVGFAAAFGRLDALPAGRGMRVRCTYGFAVLKRLPDKARAAFDRVLRENQAYPEALLGRALLAADDSLFEESLGFLNQVLEVRPGLLDARRLRALVHARAGNLRQASEEINACLEREPSAGVTLYAAACVASRVAARYADRRTAEQALDLLERAFQQDYGRDRAADDPDLASLRRLPEFRQLLARHGVHQDCGKRAAESARPTAPSPCVIPSSSRPSRDL